MSNDSNKQDSIPYPPNMLSQGFLVSLKEIALTSLEFSLNKSQTRLDHAWSPISHVALDMDSAAFQLASWQHCMLKTMTRGCLKRTALSNEPQRNISPRTHLKKVSKVSWFGLEALVLHLWRSMPFSQCNNSSDHCAINYYVSSQSQVVAIAQCGLLNDSTWQ